jgi:hypothetical protein
MARPNAGLSSSSPARFNCDSYSAAVRPQPKNHRGTQGADAQGLASFAPLRELFVSRKGAKPAKQQSELLVFGCGYGRAGLTHSENRF